MWRCIYATLIFNNILIFSSSSEERVIVVTPEICHHVTAHIPDKDVNYKGGVDVRGRAVKPADMDQNADSILNPEISFMLSLDVAKENMGNENSKRQFEEHKGLEGKINLGHVLLKEGQLTLDGKPMSSPNQEELYRLCKQR